MSDLPETTVVRGGNSSKSVDVRLVYGPGDRWTIKPDIGTRVFGLMLVLLAGFLFFIARFVEVGTPERLMTAFGGLVMAPFGVFIAFFQPEVELDRTQGRLRARRYSRQWSEWPLTFVQAIQLIDSGWHSGSRSSPAYFTYQLNLVFEDRSRVVLSNHGDAGWAMVTGTDLAKFLDKPFYDQRTPGGPPPRPRAF